MSLEEQRKEIIEELQMLNQKVSRQNSLSFIFGTGIIYGIGFVVGSAIIATIALGFVVPFFEDIPWVRDTFQRGAALLGR